jgi:antitoxin (DNA-binding transcriptional repressor) of toxin-antitoxin stability system
VPSTNWRPTVDEFTPLINDEWEQLLRDVEDGEEIAIVNGDETVAVLVSVDRFDQLLSDLARLETDRG